MIYGIGYQLSLMLMSFVSEMRCFKFLHDVKSNKHKNKTLMFCVKASAHSFKQFTSRLLKLSFSLSMHIYNSDGRHA